jgi:hypothetical protein
MMRVQRKEKYGTEKDHLKKCHRSGYEINIAKHLFFIIMNINYQVVSTSIE